jgi:hypothetical protein
MTAEARLTPSERQEFVETLRFLLRVTSDQSLILGQLVLIATELAAAQVGERPLDTAKVREANERLVEAFERHATWIGDEAQRARPD